MKYLTFILLLVVSSCKNEQQKTRLSTEADAVKPSRITETNPELCWTGTLEGKTPIFIHYQVDSNLIIGEIIYLKTKNRYPIKLLGTIEADKSYRLLEFESSGNISGVITGSVSGDTLHGTWISPKTKKELSVLLTKKDSLINAENHETALTDIYGRYHYQYSETGYQGDLEIKQLPGNKTVFGITSVTGEPSRNVAQIEDDTITLNSTRFVYKLPNADNCEFEIRFLKGFAYIRNTKGFCDGQFGMNAFIDGIYFKTD